jgi:putative ABC transport system ATP-binding protein
MSDEIYVTVSGVERSFGEGERAVRVLRGIDLNVGAGQLVALYGPSGSGKTTLLNIIGALDRPTKGQISVLGKDLGKLREGGRVQNYTLLPTYSALENIDLALRLPGMNVIQRRRRAKSALEAVGLSAWSSHVPDELSGGQRQRVAIARALALRPPLILADEPTSGLDTRTARRMLGLFRGIAEAQKTSFIIVSHDPMIAEYVDHAYDLQDGRLSPRHTSTPIIEEEVLEPGL